MWLAPKGLIIFINLLPADNDNSRFQSVLFADQTTVIGSEITL